MSASAGAAAGTGTGAPRLAAALACLYFGIVIALQQVFSSFAGGSDIPIAGSTLAVAALFGQVRHRIQSVVDRRLYRRRDAAQRTLERFASRLRGDSLWLWSRPS